jgi:hypothetical protein
MSMLERGKARSLIHRGGTMTKIEWEAFLDTHYRPRAVVLFLSMGIEPEAGELACEHLATALKPAGDYALKRERGHVRVAFELERDARRFGRATGAHQIRQEPEWALTLVGRLDRASKARGAAAATRRPTLRRKGDAQFGENSRRT